MSAETLLSRLDHVRETGTGRWIARCPAHDDRSPSLTIRELEDGRVLVHCFTGCPAGDVLAALGLAFSDLYPPRLTGHCTKPEKHPFPASDVLRALAVESAIVLTAARDLLQLAYPALETDDYERLQVACERIQSALTLSGVRPHA
ncbi:MAG: DNA primase [Candidatus Competibacteraceae bacterium]|nr:DNA primase [Candidatus Competibacteraceae bacterium]